MKTPTAITIPDTEAAKNLAESFSANYLDEAFIIYSSSPEEQRRLLERINELSIQPPRILEEEEVEALLERKARIMRSKVAAMQYALSRVHIPDPTR